MATKWDRTKDVLSGRILEAAADAFGRGGYTNTKVTDIASAAGTSSALVFKYFETKENLLCTLLREDCLKAQFEGCPSMPADKIFDRYLNRIRSCCTDNPRRFRLWLAVTQSRDVPDSVLAHLKEDFAGSAMEKAIKDALAAGYLPEGEPWNLYLLLFFSAYNIFARYSAADAQLPDNDTVLQVIRFRRPGRKRLRCAKCGQVIEIVNGTDVPVFCCGREMETVTEGDNG